MQAYVRIISDDTQGRVGGARIDYDHFEGSVQCLEKQRVQQGAKVNLTILGKDNDGRDNFLRPITGYAWQSQAFFTSHDPPGLPQSPCALDAGAMH